MRTGIHRTAAAGTGLLAAALLALGFWVPVAAAAASTATDAAGDTVTEAVEDAITAPRADIVATTVDSRPEGIVLSVRVKQLVDPMSDRNWSSDATSIAWSVDVNGDSKRDYVVEYSIDPETGQLAGFMYRTGSGGRIPDGCDEPRATFNAESGYSVHLTPSCLGNPGVLSYRVETTYDTDDTDDSAETATDTSPAGDAWTGPVALTLPPGIEPLAQGAPPQPVAPPGYAPSPSTTSPQATAPSGPNAATPTSTRPATPVAPLASRPSQNAQRPRPAAPSAPALARTGLGDRMARMAGFAVGIALIGIGLLFGNRRPSLR